MLTNTQVQENTLPTSTKQNRLRIENYLKIELMKKKKGRYQDLMTPGEILHSPSTEELMGVVL